jgi:hypothetical protein
VATVAMPTKGPSEHPAPQALFLIPSFLKESGWSCHGPAGLFSFFPALKWHAGHLSLKRILLCRSVDKRPRNKYSYVLF